MRDAEILGVSFDALTEEEAASLLFEKIKKRDVADPPASMVTPNPLTVMRTVKGDVRLLSCLNSADISLPDGIGIVSAAARKGVDLRGRATGIGTAERLLALLAETGGSVYIFGGKPGVAEAAAANLSKRFPGLSVAGTGHGYRPEADYPAIAAEIAALKPDFVAVCLGSPRQEYFIGEYLSQTRGPGAAVGLGGSADVWAGKVRRCPAFIRKIRLEWLWRMLIEPRRFSALPDLVRFRLLTRKRARKSN